MDKLRRIYQQVLLIPVSNIEQLWKEYDSFENNLNKLTVIQLNVIYFSPQKLIPFLLFQGQAIHFSEICSLHDGSFCVTGNEKSD